MFNKSIRAEIEFIDLDNGEVKLDKVEGKEKQNAQSIMIQAIRSKNSRMKDMNLQAKT